MLTTMVSSAGEINPPAHHEFMYSPVAHSNSSNSPGMICEFHPVYGQIPPDCTYYPAPEPYQFCGHDAGYPHPQMCAVNTEYGPMTVPLVSTSSTPPIPLPMQVPPGHVVQQIVDENGTLRSVIVSHQPPLMSIPFGPGSQSQPFFPPGPGFPSHFPPMQSGNLSCGMPSSQGPPTPPGPNSAQYIGQVPYSHKDERALQRAKNLRRRYEQKQRELGKDSLTPSYYHQNGGSKKGNFEAGGYNNNNQRRGVTNGALKSSSGASLEEDGSTGSVTSTGTQDEEEESRIQAQTEMLSALIPPIVSEVASRSALIKWNHPDRITESGENKFPELDVSDTDFTYDVSLNDKSQDNRFTSIFKGKDLSCRVEALKPNTLYAISYAALLHDVRGAESVATSFTTLPDVPSAPACPRATHRTRNSINLKWNSVPNDNGSKIIAYVLEFDEGKGGSHFVEAYRGKNKQCVVPNNNSFKLQPAYSYQFRLAAINSIGQSDYSPVITVMTQGCPPTQPHPPTLTEAGVTYLTLKWEGRPTDDEYQLQMEDVTSGLGFKVEYSGSAPHHACIGLQRNTEYRFRLKAKNDEGHSEWSEKVVFGTLPDRPGPPPKPSLKGRAHSRGFTVRWEPPSDDGGVPISSFTLEIDQGNDFEEMYNGTNNEFSIETLFPGQSYAVRVRAVGPAGVSDPSEHCVITTEPVCPGKCNVPRIAGKPKSDSVHLKWASPDWDGGSPINLYEVGCTTPDNQTQEAYRGKDTFCVVRSLLPGRAYLLKIRAFNRIGAGPWSDPLPVISGAGAPDAPAAIKVQTKTAHMVVLSWTEPLNNGSAITEYRVQMATLQFEEAEENLEEPEAESQTETSSNEGVVSPSVSRASNYTSVASSFSQVYLGPSLSCEVKSLQPATYYLFRVQATNTAGNSEWSPVTTHQTPASSPNVITNVEAVATSDSITLSWLEPVANGAPVTHYNVSIGEAVFLTDSTTYTVDNLMADTPYKVRVQAVNSMGPGPYSSVVKVATKPLPPPPPKLECVASAHFWMKLKWNETTNKNVEYLIQMRSPYQDEFQVVYRGSTSNCKVTRLNEDTSYSFRICAFNGAGQGPFSDWYNYTTLKAPPPPVKGLRIERSKDLELFKLEWTEITCTDSVSYKIQKAKRRDQDFKTVYCGEQNVFQISSADLDEGTEYSFRVCAIRHCSDSNELPGPYSNIVNFNAPTSSSQDFGAGKGVSSSNSMNSNGAAHFITSIYRIISELFGRVNFETRVAILGVVGFVLVACLLSLIMHHVVS